MSPPDLRRRIFTGHDGVNIVNKVLSCALLPRKRQLAIEHTPRRSIYGSELSSVYLFASMTFCKSLKISHHNIF